MLTECFLIVNLRWRRLPSAVSGIDLPEFPAKGRGRFLRQDIIHPVNVSPA